MFAIGHGPSWWPLRHLLHVRSSAGVRRIVAIWIGIIAVSVATGILNVALSWNGLDVSVLGLSVGLTIYPPMVLSVLTAVWLGPMWGVIPIYLANLASALWSGIDLPVALLFSCAGAIETAVVWGSMAILEIDPHLSTRRMTTRFLSLSLIAPVISSLGILIWNSAHGLDLAEGQRLWRGWVIGDFLQLALIVAPLLRVAGPQVSLWVDRQFDAPPEVETSLARRSAFALLMLGTMGVIVFAGIAMLQRSLDIDPLTRSRSGELLLPRLYEIQFFLLLLVVAVFISTGVFSRALGRAAERQRVLARRDALTGCFNRRAFYELFQREADRSRRLRQGLSVAFLDLDHFKSVNDRFGHDTGDRVLQQFAARLQGVVRETDLLVRWGGEEFVVLLSHTDPADAPRLAERIRTAVGERPFTDLGAQPALTLSVCVGTAGATDYPIDADRLVALAGAACQRAKITGRNQVLAAVPQLGLHST